MEKHGHEGAENKTAEEDVTVVEEGLKLEQGGDRGEVGCRGTIVVGDPSCMVREELVSV